MPYQDFEENGKLFLDLIQQLQKDATDQNIAMIKRHIEQTLIILNQIFSISISSLKKIQQSQSPADILTAQTQFIKELNTKINGFTQEFLNISLRSMSDYNEWLKAHCDLATD